MADTLTRREWLRLSSAGAIGISMAGWLETLADVTPPEKKRKSCILLWMDGGPSHIDTLDPKPDASEAKGEYDAVQTSVPGLRISSGLARTAKHMQHAAVLRGMSTIDNNHPSARVLMHTGYKNRESGLDYPTLGSIASSQIGDPKAALPSFVITGQSGPNARRAFLAGAGYLGPRHAALIADEPTKGVQNLKTPLADGELTDRLTVLQALEGQFLRTKEGTAADAHRTMLQRAVQIMRSEAAHAFDLSREKDSTRAAYGDSHFGKSVLLARRLVEVGVSFVEVYLPEWDTHSQQRAQTIKNTTMPQLDQALSALIEDLKQRGLLDTTLIVWMGEFGRTPKVKSGGGRDHYARAWSTALFGGGIKGGSVIGKTDRTGATVTDRPISVPDFMATVCLALGIDPTKKLHTMSNRPVTLVKKGANPITQILS
jgi:hypothetical protein